MENLTGKKYGRWTVLGEPLTDEKGRRSWLCRCDCGTERRVQARNLKGGTSQSCGCLLKDTKREKARNLTGQQFGHLKAEKRIEGKKGECTRWLCRCDCGNFCEVSSYRLVSGKTTHCGCRTNKSFPKDITGQKFHNLTALCPTGERDKKGAVIWHCRCDCGNEINISYNKLLYSDQISCGCKKIENGKKLNSYLTHVAGTSVDLLKSSKLRLDNRTGVTGVCMKSGRYMASIRFQGKNYYLGCYTKLEDAAYIRREAERLLHKEFLAHYEKWAQIAGKNPEWAKENPMSIHVEKKGTGDFSLSMFPIMNEIPYGN